VLLIRLSYRIRKGSHNKAVYLIIAYQFR